MFLRRINPAWANHVSVMNRVRDRTIGSFLLYTFVSRYKEILSKAHRAAVAAVPKFFPLLTREESHCEIYSIVTN